MDTGDLVIRPWRVGRSLGRTIYAMVGDEPSDDDILIGMMDHANIAAIAVLNHNNTLASQGVKVNDDLARVRTDWSVPTYGRQSE